MQLEYDNRVDFNQVFHRKIVGIMGGTFNPIHNGHIQLAVRAHEQFDIPDILVMPSGTPAYKSNKQLASTQDRCNMVAEAIKEYDYMHLSTLEVERKGNTYTSDTLLILKEQYDEIFFIIGADSLFALDTWHEPEIVCSNCHLIAANRDQRNMQQLEVAKNELVKKYGAVIDFLSTEDMPYSSSLIRDYVKMGKSIHTMVPSSVEEYIKIHQLY